MEVLFFTPHAALWPHTAPEAYLARALAEYGHEIRYLSCGKAQSYCSVMTARRIPAGGAAETRHRVCSDCTAAAAAIARVYRFPLDMLIDFISAEERAACEATAARAVAARSLDTTSMGLNIGRIALYEFTLTHKKMSTDLTETQWEEYGIILANALVSLTAFAAHLRKHRPQAIVAFSPQYSNINSCMQHAIKQGVRVLFIESGTNLSHRLGTMRVWDWKVHKLVNPALTYWGSSSDNPLTAEAAASVTGHFRQLLTGSHFAVFSAPYAGTRGIRERWGIKPGQRVLLLTLSSYDEAYAALLIGAFPEQKVFSDVFRTQADWLRATIQWAASRPDLFVVIRVHPRDFPNKRESFRSEQSYMLEDLLADTPSNVHVNWPGENVSLYELLEDTDAVLTGWSVTAMEALVLGIPVVTYDARLPSYPPDIMYTGRSADEYFDNIDRALSDGWRLENAVNGFRWLGYNFVTCTTPVSQTFGRQESRQISYIGRLWMRIKGRFPQLDNSIDLLNWRDALPGAQFVSDMLERGYDALPPAKRARLGNPATTDDLATVMAGLKELHDMLNASAPLPDDKPGLSRNIRRALANNGVAP
ncbi:hypothetical protein GIW81_10025 [Hyphomicrobium sp. xq]|uniref:Capsule polysaccharide biosynthesis protein n=1 Tax=Hyphomicrobium album TaxID=2665159 RepID=A0A6I3KLQ0_9HYPH|nr:hypothetical protein [Hyphomicrobium album]MTD94667.1 hypothetical protein [Hyphomicrobium album]